jgi:hypothetical protein
MSDDQPHEVSVDDDPKPRKSIRDDEFTKRVHNSRREMVLTEDEISDLRNLLEHQKRIVWFWATVKTWAIWITAVAAGVTIGWDALSRIVQTAVHK